MPRLLEIIRHAAGPALRTRRVALHPGKMVLEVRPDVDWDKGNAVVWLASQLLSPVNQPVVIYLGDDETDEDAFAALPGEITVFVGDDPDTTANYFARDPEEVHRFLSWLLRMIGNCQSIVNGTRARLRNGLG